MTTSISSLPSVAAPAAPMPARSFSPIIEGGIDAVRTVLGRIGLERYAESFDDIGYDDLAYLLHLNAARLGEVAEEVGMKPGHRRKFVDMLREASGVAK